MAVTVDKTCILKSMDLNDRLNLRSVTYLEAFMDMMPVLDGVMCNVLGLAKRYKQGLRPFLTNAGHRLSMLMDMSKVFSILDEAGDMAKMLPEVVEVMSQPNVARECFEKRQVCRSVTVTLRSSSTPNALRWDPEM